MFEHFSHPWFCVCECSCLSRSCWNEIPISWLSTLLFSKFLDFFFKFWSSSILFQCFTHVQKLCFLYFCTFSKFICYLLEAITINCPCNSVCQIGLQVILLPSDACQGTKFMSSRPVCTTRWRSTMMTACWRVSILIMLQVSNFWNPTESYL